MIIGDKLRGIQENKYQQIFFNDNHLAEIFNIENDDHIEFYECDAVRKVVDFQFVKTKKFLTCCFAVYMIGFVIPFLLSLSVKD